MIERLWRHPEYESAELTTLPHLHNYEIVDMDINPGLKDLFPTDAENLNDARILEFIDDYVLDTISKNRRLGLTDTEQVPWSTLITINSRAGSGGTWLQNALIDRSLSYSQIHAPSFDESRALRVVTGKIKPDPYNKPSDNTVLSKTSEDLENEISEAIEAGGVIYANLPTATAVDIKDDEGNSIFKITERAFNPDTHDKLYNFKDQFNMDNERRSRFINLLEISIIPDPTVTFWVRYRQLLKTVGSLDLANRYQKIFSRPPIPSKREYDEAKEGAPLRHFLETEYATRRVTWSIFHYIYESIPVAERAIIEFDMKTAKPDADNYYSDTSRDRLIIKTATDDIQKRAWYITSFITSPNSRKFTHQLALTILQLAYMPTEIEIDRHNTQFGKYPTGAPLVRLYVTNHFDLDSLEKKRKKLHQIFEVFGLN